MKRYALFAALICISVLGSASADSLWSATARPVTSDIKAHKLGDLINIIVVESSSSAQKQSTDFTKQLNHSNQAGVGPLMKFLPQFGLSSSQSGAATGDTSNSLTFTATVSAKVTKVLPNGNLIVEGVKSVNTLNDKQEIKLSGELRPEDIGTDNTVLSTCLADAKIESSGKGIISDRQREGIFSKLLKLLF